MLKLGWTITKVVLALKGHPHFQFGAPFPYSSTLTQSDYNSQRLSSLIGMSGLGAGMVDLSSCMNE